MRPGSAIARSFQRIYHPRPPKLVGVQVRPQHVRVQVRLGPNTASVRPQHVQVRPQHGLGRARY